MSDKERLAQIEKEIEREDITELDLMRLEAEARAIYSSQLLALQKNIEELLSSIDLKK